MNKKKEEPKEKPETSEEKTPEQIEAEKAAKPLHLKKTGPVASGKIASKFTSEQKFKIQRNRGWRGGSGKP